MHIVNSFPPNFVEIAMVFPQAGNKGVIFTYGDTIYNPTGTEISLPLMVHEGIHSSRQQKDGVEAWWAKYLADPEFRLEEELPAHRAEYRTFLTTNKDRNARNLYLQAVANRLSGPLYGNLLTPWKARKEITK